MTIQVGGTWRCEKCGESYHSSEMHTCAPDAGAKFEKASERIADYINENYTFGQGTEQTDLFCKSPQIASAVKTYLDEQMRRAEDPPLVTAIVVKSTVRIVYKGHDFVMREAVDAQLVGFRDGYGQRASASSGDSVVSPESSLQPSPDSASPPSPVSDSPATKSEWRDIESAPNGLRVLVREGDWIGISSAINGWWGRGEAYTIRIHPTHWMPLPAPPATTQSLDEK